MCKDLFYCLTSQCLCEVLIFSDMPLFNINVYELWYPERVSNQKYLSWQNQLSIHFHWKMTARTIYRGGHLLSHHFITLKQEILKLLM